MVGKLTWRIEGARDGFEVERPSLEEGGHDSSDRDDLRGVPVFCAADTGGVAWRPGCESKSDAEQRDGDV